MSEITINDIGKVELTAAFKDAHGNPTAPLITPVWTTDHADLVTLVPAADGKTCEVSALGPLGVADVTCASQDFAGTTISDSCAVTVVASGPESVVVEPGTPG